MQITLAEARLLKNSVSKKLHDLIRERQSLAYVEYGKGEDYTTPHRTFNEVSQEIERVRQHYRSIKRVLAVANLETTIKWNGEVLPIVEALELVKQLRNEADALKNFGNSPTVERITKGTFDTSVMYKKALFEPIKVKKQAEEVLKTANRLSILIDKANFEAVVELDFVEEYQ